MKRTQKEFAEDQRFREYLKDENGLIFGYFNVLYQEPHSHVLRMKCAATNIQNEKNRISPPSHRMPAHLLRRMARSIESQTGTR